tara:strand:+ start:1273 stop:1578 length:306 start_codon:yes stop_codon:yes gene_type:complete
MKIWDDVYHVIMNCNNDELNEIIDMVKTKQRRLREDASRNFIVGDWVKFDAGKRGTITGVITKVNSKSVLVRQSVDKKVINWKVNNPAELKLASVSRTRDF